MRIPALIHGKTKRFFTYKTISLAACAFVCICIASCAKRGDPGGGPKDETPPFISIWEPIQGSQGIAADAWVTLEWNEPVDRSTVSQNLVVSPDTSIIDQKWDDLTLRVRPRGGWQDTPVQWILMGEGVIDRHDLRSEEQLYLWFTTRDTLSPTSVKGTLLLAGGDVPARGARISVSDSTGFPVWRLFSSDDGTFEMNGLPLGEWNIRAHLDVDKDDVYDRGIEPWSESTFTVTMDSTFAISLSLAIEDTIPPRVMVVRAPHRSLVRLGMSEPVLVDETSEFALLDTAGVEYPIESANSSLSTPGMVDLYLRDPMRDDEMRIFISTVRDTMGLILADTTVSFMGTSLADTMPPSITQLWYHETEVWPVSVVFSEAVKESLAEAAFEVIDLGNLTAMPGSLFWRDPSILSWVPAESTGTDDILLRITGEILDHAGNSLGDTMYRTIPTPKDSLLPPWEPMPRTIHRK